MRELLRADFDGRGHVLAVAAGTGQFTFELADTAKRLTATDISREMVQRLKAKFAERGVGHGGKRHGLAPSCCPGQRWLRAGSLNLDRPISRGESADGASSSAWPQAPATVASSASPADVEMEPAMHRPL